MIPVRALVVATFSAAACQFVGSDEPAEDVPALIFAPTPTSTSELREVLEKALPERRILLADDAFEESSLLIIERRRHDRLEGPLAAGVPDETPQRFRLVIADGHAAPGSSPPQTRATSRPVACALVHLNTGKRYPLSQTRCHREPKAAD